jgi:flagellar motor component MotA
LALEAEAETLDDDFMKKGVELFVDGTDAELVREILETELSFLEKDTVPALQYLTVWEHLLLHLV